MDIRNSLDGLKSLFGVESAAPTARETRKSQTSANEIGSDHATLSSAANEVAQTTREDSVRTDKIVSIQAALATGTYSVPASAVADKVIDAMLGASK